MRVQVSRVVVKIAGMTKPSKGARTTQARPAWQAKRGSAGRRDNARSKAALGPRTPWSKYHVTRYDQRPAVRTTTKVSPPPQPISGGTVQSEKLYPLWSHGQLLGDCHVLSVRVSNIGRGGHARYVVAIGDRTMGLAIRSPRGDKMHLERR